MTEKEFIELKYSLEKLKVKPQKITFLDVIDKVYDENIISNWLSFIFNPNINGIGNKPIEILLNSVNSEIDLENENFVEVKREETTTNKKRMDLVIKYSNTWIVIENKIRSSEYDDQTTQYYNNIEKERNNDTVGQVVYIYLRPDWNNPGNKNIPKKKFDEKNNKNGFRNLFYSRLISGLKEVNFFDYKEDEKFIYLKNFIEIGEKYYMGQEFKITEEIELYINHMEDIEEIQNQYNNIRVQILSKIKKLLENQFNEYYINDSSIKGNYYQIANQSWNNNYKTRNEIHYEIFSSDFSRLVGNKKVHIKYYIHIENGVSIEKREKIYNKIKNKDNIKIEKYNNSNLWLNLYEDDYDFGNEEEIGKSINKIINKMIEIDKIWKPEIESWKNIENK